MARCSKVDKAGPIFIMEILITEFAGVLGAGERTTHASRGVLNCKALASADSGKSRLASSK